MQSLRLVAVIPLVWLLTSACGSVTMTGGTGGQNGSGGRGGGTGGSHATGGAGGGPSCSDLQNEYATALQQARSCSPNSGSNQCDQQAASTLGCDCQTFVNDKTALEQIQSRWSQAGCQAVCPAIACLAPKSGACRAADAGGGTCVDVLTSTP